MQAGLVSEGAGPDIGLAAVGRNVGDLADGVRDPGGLAQASRLQQRHTLLDLQVRDQGEDVRVTGALSVAVDGPLHVGRARVDGGHRVGDRTAGVVVAVDAHARTGRVDDIANDVGDLGREHPPVGVAQRDDLGARLGRGPDALQRIGPVQPVAVEEVLRVEEHPPPLTAQEGHRVANHREVLLQRGPQGLLDVPGMRLGHEGDDRRSRVEQGPHERVGVSARPRSAGGAEGGQRGVAQRQLALGSGEELRVLGVGAWPATLNEAHPELVKLTRNDELVGYRQVETLLLGAVAQGRVVDVQVGAGRGHRIAFGSGHAHAGSSLLAGGGGAWTNKKTPRVREVCATRECLVALR